jgi:UDP-N-acetylmuramate--alanine ligase
MARMIDFDSAQRIHFIGIGGIGMSALARHCLTEKKTVSGSDRVLSDITKHSCHTEYHIW